MASEFLSHFEQREGRMPAAELTERTLFKGSDCQLSRLTHSTQDPPSQRLLDQAVVTPIVKNKLGAYRESSSFLAFKSKF